MSFCSINVLHLFGNCIISTHRISEVQSKWMIHVIFQIFQRNKVLPYKLFPITQINRNGGREDKCCRVQYIDKTSQPSCKSLCRVARDACGLAFSWWNAMPFLRANLSRFWSIASCNSHSYEQYFSIIMVLISGNNSQ